MRFLLALSIVITKNKVLPDSFSDSKWQNGANNVSDSFFLYVLTHWPLSTCPYLYPCCANDLSGEYFIVMWCLALATLNSSVKDDTCICSLSNMPYRPFLVKFGGSRSQCRRCLLMTLSRHSTVVLVMLYNIKGNMSVVDHSGTYIPWTCPVVMSSLFSSIPVYPASTVQLLLPCPSW